jgi:trigger factor
MNITKENIDELNAIINVSIEKNDYEATVNDVLRDYRKKANMPGFRPGKVPAGLIKKNVWQSHIGRRSEQTSFKGPFEIYCRRKTEYIGRPASK